MRLDQWQALGIVSGSLVALLTLTGLLYRWVVRPVFRLIKRLNAWLDSVNGDRGNGVPSLLDRVKSIEQKQQEHLDWHAVGGRGNGPRPPTGRPGIGGPSDTARARR
jgi:hypothetical protein